MDEVSRGGAAALRPPGAPDRQRHTHPEARPGLRVSRGEAAATQLIGIAEAAVPGSRLGSKDDLRARCHVSVGTFNEAVRIAQSRGVVTVRPGPGGGVFAATQSPIVRLGNSVLALDGDQTSVAEAVRIRDSLDPLLIGDALWHASPADIAEMREILRDMAMAVDNQDASGFLHANWSLHARIAAVSPHAMLRALYVNLLDHIESHILAVLPSSEQPLPEYMRNRHALHARLVSAIEARDRDLAVALIAEHNTGNVRTTTTS